MSIEDPIVLLVLIGVVAYVGYLWLKDYRDNSDEPNPAALPGATKTSSKAVLIAVMGALIILGIEIVGEYGLGIVEEQSTLTWLFALYTLFAAFGEEVIFRGYLVVGNKGKGMLVGSIVFFSLIFALLHGHVVIWDDEGFRVVFETKGLFTTAMLFLGSIWFYVARFASWNTTQSLIPCVAAHLAKNLGVIVAKLVQGQMGGLGF